MKEAFEKIKERLEEKWNDTVVLADEDDYFLGRSSAFRDALSIVSEVEAEYGNGWIPCSERYPNKEEYLKNDGRFIVTDGYRVYQSIYDIYINRCFRTPKLFNLFSGRQWEFEIDNCVIAWMPLPEPYKPEKGV